MREAFGPFLASLGQVRRRSIAFLLAATVVVWGLITWASYTEYRSQRHALQLAEQGRLRGPEIFQLIRGGFSCDDQLKTCQITNARGEPIGPPFPQPDFTKFGAPEEDPFADAIRNVLPQLLPSFRADLARQGAQLAPLTVLTDRARAMGTFFGILFVVFIASTFIGAEWRWGVWRTLLTHEPRRGRVLAAKLGALWVAVAVGALGVLALTAGLDAIFRGISDISASGGPSAATFARVSARSLLSLELYASAAAAMTMLVRTSFAGMGALLFILADGLATRRFIWLRHYLPNQQIATLIPPGSDFLETPGFAWWPLISTGAARCAPDAGGAITCIETPLALIPHWRASLVLAAWIAGFVLVTWALLRARDVPQ